MIDNLTPFGAAAVFAYDLDGSQIVVLSVAATFRLPAPGVKQGLALADRQPPPSMADRHVGSPADSSLRVPGQGTPLRPGTDIYLHGAACAPRGAAVTQLPTRLAVGNCRKDVHVVGERRWTRGLIGPRPGAPEPFTRMPLLYERAFGGTVTRPDGTLAEQEARNPIGRGLHASAHDAIDQPLHNLEKPGETAQDWSDRLTPCGYGPMPGAWQPRLALAGTYDQHWIDTRMPLWPADLDRRFFHAAAPGLVHETPLIGGEPVLLDGFHHDGAIAFKLPICRVLAKSYFHHRAERVLMRMGAVLFDTDAQTFTLFWHHAVPAGRGHTGHLRSVVRLLEPWEGLL